MRVFYAEANYGEDEIKAATNVLKHSRLALMCGENVVALEHRVANLFRKDFGLMSNSGSSANLLGVKALNLPRGSKVITPSLTFSTTVAPLVQSDLIPYFVDIDIDTLQIDTDLLTKMDTTNVSAICVPNLIGNLANWKAIYDFAKENNILVVEDSADTIGYDYPDIGEDWSDVATTSFYASHVVTGAGFGGMTSFKNEKHYQAAKSLRGWGRRSSLYGETEDYERRFNCQIDGMDYDDKYIFDDLGYNLLPSEISAAFALVQLDHLKENVNNRSDNFHYLSCAISHSPNMRTFETYENVYTGWLAFPLMLTGKLKDKRKQVQIYLEKSGIQTRTIFTGNILRQPVSQKFKWDSFGTFGASDEVMGNGILLGCHNQMTRKKLDYTIEKLLEAEKCLA